MMTGRAATIYVQTYGWISAKLCVRFCKVVIVKSLFIVFGWNGGQVCESQTFKKFQTQ